MEKGVLTVISGFSGAGKGTIMAKLVHKYPYFLSISATTRKPRAGEVDGREYYFHTKEEFKKMIADDELIEWAEYVGNYYGTPKQAVEKQLAEGKDVILEIEMQGGMLVREQFPQALLLFVTPPSTEELKRRLSGRGTEDPEDMHKRLIRASEEVAYMKDYDYIIVNDDLDEAVERIHNIISNEHCRVSRCASLIQEMNTGLSQFAKGE